MINTKTNAENIDFETALNELEKIVKELESDVNLAKAVSLFEEGSKLSQICQKHLTDASQKIEILRKQNTGELVLDDVSNSGSFVHSNI